MLPQVIAVQGGKMLQSSWPFRNNLCPVRVWHELELPVVFYQFIDKHFRVGVKHIVVSGSGEFLAGRLAARILAPGGEIISLADFWGEPASVAACARSLLVLFEGLGGMAP